MEPLDWSSLRANCAGDESLVNEVLALFHDEAEGLLRDVGQAVSAGDAEGVKRTAHRLKGALVSLAAGPSTEAARSLEACGETGELAGAAALFTELEAELSRLLTEISLLRAA